MITNVNDSKNPSNGTFADVRKFIGVASINVLAINPSNDKLRTYGWQIPEDAEEPTYVTTKEQDGKQVKSARVRFLVQIQDLEDKPVISMDFWVRPELMVNKDGTKCKIIDSFGRTAWATKAEVTAKKIPQYASGQANISLPYKPCHSGEEELVSFIFKYLNITPFQVFDRVKNAWVPTKDPGRLTIDNWNKLCDGDVTEIAEYIATKPNNRVKVILGIRSTDDNKSYQAFMNSTFIGNGATPDRNTGEYLTARKQIDKYTADHTNSPYSFSASPVTEWKVTASSVEDNTASIFDSTNTIAVDDDPSDDLPF